MSELTSGAIRTQHIRKACGAVLTTIYLFDRETGGAVELEQIERIDSKFSRKDIVEAIRYLIDGGYVEDKTKRVNFKDTRTFIEFGITKAGRDLYLGNIEDAGVILSNG